MAALQPKVSSDYAANARALGALGPVAGATASPDGSGKASTSQLAVIRPANTNLLSSTAKAGSPSSIAAVSGLAIADATGNYDGSPTGSGAIVSGAATETSILPANVGANGATATPKAGAQNTATATSTTQAGAAQATPTTAQGGPVATATTAIQATSTPVPPTATTAVQPTATNTVVAPTNTPVLPTNTPVPPTNTSVPPTATTAPRNPSVSLSPSSIQAGQTVTGTLSGFPSNTEVTLSASGSVLTTVTTDSSGGYSYSTSIPSASEICSWFANPPKAGTRFPGSLSASGGGSSASASFILVMPSCS